MSEKKQVRVVGFRSKTPWRMALATFVYGMVLMVIVIAIINPSSEDDLVMQENDPIKAIVKETLGKDNYKSHEEINRFLKLQLNGSDRLTKSLTRSGIYRDVVEIIPELFEQTEFTKVEIDWYMDLVDVRGNETNTLVATVMFMKKNASTVNWENVLYDNIPKIADYHWIHNALK